MLGGDIEAVILPDHGGVPEQGQHRGFVGLDVSGNEKPGVALGQQRPDGVILPLHHLHIARSRIGIYRTGARQADQRRSFRQRNQLILQQIDDHIAAAP
ncbi:hypothetical protein D3C75_1071260 [compost metagenome]